VAIGSHREQPTPFLTTDTVGTGQETEKRFADSSPCRISKSPSH
jgi:hypothetical protein